MTKDMQKQMAAQAAAATASSGMYIGLGSGSTSMLAVRQLGERMERGEITFRGVCSSRTTLMLAEELGIPCDPVPTDQHPDLYIDGADQIDAAGRMIKGGGGALLREKILAAASRNRIIIVDASKPVARLGVGFPLPVDINPFGFVLTMQHIREATGANTVLRLAQGDVPFETDDKNLVVDCHFPEGIENPEGTEQALKSIPGVVETGLFFGLCDLLIVGTDQGVETTVFSRAKRDESR